MNPNDMLELKLNAIREYLNAVQLQVDAVIEAREAASKELVELKVANTQLQIKVDDLEYDVHYLRMEYSKLRTKVLSNIGLLLEMPFLPYVINSRTVLDDMYTGLLHANLPE